MNIDGVSEYDLDDALKITEFLKSYEPTNVVLDSVYINNVLSTHGYSDVVDIALNHFQSKVDSDDSNDWDDIRADKECAAKWVDHLSDGELYFMKEISDDLNSLVPWKDIYAPKVEGDFMRYIYDASNIIKVRDYIMDNLDEIQQQLTERYRGFDRLKEHKTLSCFRSTKKLTDDLYSVNLNTPLMPEVVRVLKYTSVVYNSTLEEI